MLHICQDPFSLYITGCIFYQGERERERERERDGRSVYEVFESPDQSQAQSPISLSIDTQSAHLSRVIFVSLAALSPTLSLTNSLSHQNSLSLVKLSAPLLSKERLLIVSVLLTRLYSKFGMILPLCAQARRPSVPHGAVLRAASAAVRRHLLHGDDPRLRRLRRLPEQCGVLPRKP